MDYNVRMENICVNRSLVSLISLCLSPVRQSSALSSPSISLLCPGASQHGSTRHAHTSPSGANSCAGYARRGAFPPVCSARPRPAPPPHGRIRPRGAFPAACSTWRAASLPAGGALSGHTRRPPRHLPTRRELRRFGPLAARCGQVHEGSHVKSKAWSIGSLAVVVELQLAVQ